MTPSGGLHAAALSSRLARARSSRAGLPVDEGRPRVELEARRRARAGAPGRPPARPARRGRPPRTPRRPRTPWASETTSLTRSRQLRQLRGDVADELAPLGRGQAVARALQHLEVGARAGQRRAQLVRGVGDEAPLRRARLLDRGQHGVEALGEAAQLVLAGDLDAPRQVVRRRDVLGGLRELAHRREHRARPSRPSAAASSVAPAPTAISSSTRRSRVASTSSSGRTNMTATPGATGAVTMRTVCPSTLRSDEVLVSHAGRHLHVARVAAHLAAARRAAAITSPFGGHELRVAAGRAELGRGHGDPRQQHAFGATGAPGSMRRRSLGSPSRGPAASRRPARASSSPARRSRRSRRPAREATATDTAETSVSRVRRLSRWTTRRITPRAARSRRRGRCGSGAARPPPRSCGAGSRRRPRGCWSSGRSRSPTRGRR